MTIGFLVLAMRLAFKAAAVSLLLGLVAATLAASTFPAATPSRPAGCHRHSHREPAPGPVSYNCCQAGHGSALLQTQGVFATLAFSSLLISRSPGSSFALTSLGCIRYQITSPTSPPGDIPQRI
jgi:hypothetical protein